MFTKNPHFTNHNEEANKNNFIATVKMAIINKTKHKKC